MKCDICGESYTFASHGGPSEPCACPPAIDEREAEQCDWCGQVCPRSTMRETSHDDQLACEACWRICVECPHCHELVLETESDEGYHPRCHPSGWRDDDRHDRDGFYE